LALVFGLLLITASSSVHVREPASVSVSVPISLYYALLALIFNLFMYEYLYEVVYAYAGYQKIIISAWLE